MDFFHNKIPILLYFFNFLLFFFFFCLQYMVDSITSLEETA